MKIALPTNNVKDKEHVLLPLVMMIHLAQTTLLVNLVFVHCAKITLTVPLTVMKALCA